MSPRQIANRIESPSPAPARTTTLPSSPERKKGPSFADELQKAEDRQTKTRSDVHLSAHAEQRIQQRDISLSATERQTLGTAMHKLDEKGSRDALLLRSDAAFVVNVPNRTVVTAMNQDELQERIFTQIDSAMLIS